MYIGYYRLPWTCGVLHRARGCGRRLGFLSLTAAITKLFPDNGGTQVVFIDEKSDGFLYNPVSGTCKYVQHACVHVCV